MSRVTRDRTAEPVLQGDQIPRRGRGQGNFILPCSADHEQDWHPYLVDPYSAIPVCDLTTHLYIYADSRVEPQVMLDSQNMNIIFLKVPLKIVLIAQSVSENSINSAYGHFERAEEAFSHADGVFCVIYLFMCTLLLGFSFLETLG